MRLLLRFDLLQVHLLFAADGVSLALIPTPSTSASLSRQVDGQALPTP